MPFYEDEIKTQQQDVELLRVASTALGVAAGVMGGVALSALTVEHRPVKAAVSGAVAAGLGWMAHFGSNAHENAAQYFGQLKAQ